MKGAGRRRCWCHVISYLRRFPLRTVAIRLTLAPLPAPLGERLSFAVPLQLGGSHPRGVPQHGTTLMFVVKALGSVKHEGPTTSRREIGVICQALNTTSFTSSCQAYDGALCSDLPGHHCLLASTWCAGLHFSSSFLCACLHSRDFLLDLSRLLGTAPFSLLSFDATGKSLPCWGLALAQEAAHRIVLRRLLHIV